MRTRTPFTLSPVKALALSAGLLVATAGMASAAGAAPTAEINPDIRGPLTPGAGSLITVPPRPTTTTTKPKVKPPKDLCRLAPHLCHPPVDPCTGKPLPQPEPPVIRRESDGLTRVPPRPSTTTTKPCPKPSTTTTKPTRKPPVHVDPPIRVKPNFTG